MKLVLATTRNMQGTRGRLLYLIHSVVAVYIIIKDEFTTFEDAVFWDVILCRLVDSSSKILVPIYQAAYAYMVAHPGRE
jgi:hypothetical protein